MYIHTVYIYTSYTHTYMHIFYTHNVYTNYICTHLYIHTYTHIYAYILYTHIISIYTHMYMHTLYIHTLYIYTHYLYTHFIYMLLLLSHSVMSHPVIPWTTARQAGVHHQLPELTPSHVRRDGDAIQPSHPLSSPSPPAFHLSQHRGLLHMNPFFTSGGQSSGA